MTREQAVEFLEKELKKMKEQNVAEKMRNHRIEELKEVAKTVEFLPLLNFVRKPQGIDLEIYEFPKSCHCELAFYVWISGINDYFFFEEPEEFEDLYRHIPEKLAQNIAQVMEKENLCECSLEELVNF